MIALLSLSGVLGVPTAQAALRAFAPRFATTARGDIKLIGNTLLTCPASTTCTAGLAQTPPPTVAATNIDNNDFAMINLDVDGVGSPANNTVNSSSADLALGTCSNVLFAGLYWSALSTNATRNQIQFGFGNTIPVYQLITASQVDVSPSTYPNSYQSFADVTTQVQATGSGRYWGANVQATLGTNTWAGWSLEVVCGDSTASLKRLMVYDGFQTVPPSPLTITLSNFFTPPVGSFTGAVGMVAYDGDRGAIGDGATFSTDKVATATNLTDALHPSTNFFNSSIADAGVNVTARNPNNPNTLGFDIARITNNINQTTVGNGASSFSFKFVSSSETYEPGVFTFAMVVYEPEIFPVKTVSDINGGSLVSGDILEYTIAVANSGSDPATPVVLDDPIPANTSYVPGSLQIVSGPNAGTKTDAASDDQAEFSAGAVHFRLGTGANATVGGLLDCTNATCPNVNPTTTTVRFRVTLNNSTPANTAISNSADVTYAGQSAAAAGSLSGHTTSGAASTSVTTSAPSIAKSFTPATIATGAVSQLQLTLTNPNASTALTGVAVTDSFPAGLSVANPPGFSNTCGGTVSPGAMVGNTSLALTGGSIAANSSCTISVNVTSTTLGTVTNTTGVVSASNGGNGNTASATLLVNAPALKLTKSDGGTSTTPGGTVVYALGYQNTGNAALTSVTLNETVPANSTFNIASSSAGWNCANGSPAGTACSLTIGALALAASGSANFAVTVNNPVPAGTTQIANSATITANGGTNAAASDTTPVTSAPALSLSKTDGGVTATPGNPLVYTLSYQNTGNIGLTGVVINETVPANSTFRSTGSTAGWSCANGSAAGTACTLAIGALAGGASGTATFAVTVANPVSAGTTQIVNNATISDGSTSATGSDTAPVATTPGLSISKSDGGISTTPGGTVPYTLNYQNTGNVGLTSVVINESVPANSTFNATSSSAGWSCANGSPAGTSCTRTIGALAGGASGSATFAVTVINPVPAGTTQIANSATIADASGHSASNSDTTPVIATPSLSLTKSDGGASTTPGGTVVYTLSYQNTGNIGLAGVTLNEIVPANSTFNAASSSAGWSCANGAPASSACALTIGNLAAGASASATFAVTANNPVPAGTTQIANSATITANGGTTASASDTTPVVTTPALSLTKSDGGATTTPGGSVPYTLSYANTGNVGLTGVVINETVPANSTFTSASSSAGWSCANGSPAGTACALTLGSLASGASGSVTFAVTVVNPVPAGTTQIANSATITSGSTSATASDSTPVTTTPSLSLIKSDGGATTTPGGAVVYTLSYQNTGNIGLTGVVINETVPANSTFRTTGSSAGWSCANGSPAGTACTLTIGSLAAGASGSATFAVLVTSPLPAGVTQIANSATITNGTTSATDSDVTPVTTTPGLTITKSDGGATTTPGGTVVYTLGYANTGNVGLTGVVINETVPINTTFSSTSSSAGWSCANGSPAGTSCTRTIGALAGSASGTAAFAVKVVAPLPAGVSEIANSVTIADASGHSAANSDTTPVITTPRLSLTKSDGGATVTPGNPIIYSLAYANTGNVELTDVVINEIVPANSAFRSAGSTAGWSCADGSPAGSACTLSLGSLIGGASGTATFAVTANTPVPAGTTQIANAATITDGSTSATGSDTTPMTTAPSLSLSKSDGGAISIPGGMVLYTLSYANTGNIGLSGVVLNETVPANSTFDAANSSAGWSCANGSAAGTACTLAIGALAGGASATANFAVTVNTPVPAGTTQIANSATITNGPTSATGSDTTPVNTSPDMSLTKSDGGVTTTPGGTVAYSLDYQNTGNVNLAGVVINETVPANSTFRSAGSTAGWSCANGSPAGTACTLTIGALAGGASGTATFAVTVNNPVPAGTTQITNSATITNGPTSATGSDTTPVNTTPGLTITKSDGGATTTPGGTVAYTLGYANSGNVGLTGIVINETVPANTSFAAAGSSGGWSCADGASAGTACSLSIGSLAAGRSGSATFAVTVNPTVPAGTTQIANSVTIADASAHSASNSDITPVTTTPALSLTKSDGGASVIPGGTVVYALNYQNTGDVGLTGVVLNETVPTNSTFSTVGSTAGWSCANGAPAGSACVLSIGALAAGASDAATFVVVADTPFPAGVSQLANAATITDGSTSTTASDTTPVTITPGLRITKSDGDVTTTPGGTVVYSLSYQNTGNVDLTGVVINELVPANSTFVAGLSSAGWSCVDGAQAGTACRLTLGNLAGGANSVAAFAVVVNDPVPAGTTQLANSATISAGTTSATGSDTTPVTTAPRLSLTKSDGGTTSIPGGTVAYTLDYANTGNVGLTGVVINETVPANSTFRVAGSSTGWSCANGAPAGTACTLTIGALAGDASGTATFAVTVNNPVPAGVTQIANSATITNGPTSATGSDTTPVNTTPGLTITKSDGGATTTPGGTVAYTLGYANTGNVGLTGVAIHETVPANSSFTAGASSAGWSCADGDPAGTTCTFTIGNLAAGGSGAAIFAVLVDAPLSSGVAQITNAVTITASNGTSANNSDSTPIITAPSMTLIKSDAGVTTTPGSTIAYGLSYQNTGDVNLTGVLLNEIVPANTTFRTAGSTAGWSCADGSPAGTSCILTLGALAGSASGTATFVVNVLNAVPAGTTQIANSATITDGTTSATGNLTTPLATAPSMTLTKSDAGSSTAPGGTVVYTLSYQNTGNVNLTGVVLNEIVPTSTTFRATGSSAGWSCADGDAAGTTCTLTVGALAGGASGSASFAVTVDTPVPAGTTQIANSAMITDGSTSATSSDTTPVNTTPGVSLTKSDGGATTTPGSIVAYTLSYTNTGNVGLAGVVLNEIVPPNSTFSSAGSSGGWSCADDAPAGTACTLAIGVIAGGASDSVTFAVTVDDPMPAGTTQLANSATITDGTTSATSSDTTPIITTPSLSLTKSDGGATTTPGGAIVYTLSYTNTGDVGLIGVVLNEIVPTNTTFRSSGSSAGWSCANASPTGTSCTLTLGALPGGASGSATYAVTVNTPLPAGTIQIANAATISDGTTSATGSDTTPVATTPSLSLTKSDAGASVIPGGAVVYILNYANTGNVGLTGVTIDEIVPANSSFDAANSDAGWSCANGSAAGTACTLAIGALAGGASGSVTFAVTAINPVPVGTTQLANSATITDGTTSATGSDTTPVITTPSLSLIKSDGGTTTTPGGAVVYTLSYQNTGNVGLTGVLISELVPANTTFRSAGSTAGWSCANGSPAGTACTLAIGALAGGASGSATFAVTVVNPLPAGVTQIANSATISTGTTSATGSDTTPVNTTPGLTVTKSDGGATTTPGGTVVYTLGYANTGNVGLTGVVLNESVPANTTFRASGSTAGWSCADGASAGTSCTLAIGALAGGASGSASFAVAVVNPLPAGVAQIANSVTLADANGHSSANSDTTPVITTAGLSLSKSDGGATTTPGGTVVYSLDYANTGDVGLAGVAINEIVPANSSFDAASSSAGWSCADNAPAGSACTLALGNLAGGASASAAFAVTVNNPVPAGTVQLANAATITDGTISATGSDSTPVITTPSLSLSKSDGGATTTPGGTVVYSLDYANTGDIGLTSVVINEIVPANSTFNAANSSAGWSCANGSPAGSACAITIGALAGGAHGLVTFAVTVANPIPAGTTQLANSATITDGTTSATGSATTPIATMPSLSLSKSDGGTTTTPGGALVYTLGYANTGNVGLTGVVINETVPANSTFAAAGSSAGWSCADGSSAGTICTLTLGTLAGGASGIANFAIVILNPVPAGTTQIANAATITNGPTSATGSDTTPVITTPGLIITKSDGGVTTTPGGTVVYTLGYANSGNVGLTGVAINEIVPADTSFDTANSSAGWSCADGNPAGTTCTFSIGALAANASGSSTFAVKVNQAVPAGTTQLANTVTLTDDNGHSAANSDTTPLNTTPGLALSKSDGGVSTTPGGTVVYTLSYTNTGNVGLTSVVLNEIVPINTSFSTAGSTTGWSCANGAPAISACTLTIGNLAAGASGTATFAVVVDTPFPASASQIANSAMIAGGTASATASDSTPVITTPGLAIIKSDGGVTSAPGGTVVYTLSYTNTGNVDLDAVAINELVPANSTFNTAGSTAGWSCANGSPAGTTCALPLGNLAGGASGTAAFAVTIDDPVPAGTTQIANSATITDGTTSATGSDTTPLTTTPSLSLTKSDGDATAVPGALVIYTLEYANTGDVGLAGVTLNETVPANTTFRTTGSTAGWSCADGSPVATSCTLTIGALAGGASGTSTFAVIVANPVPAGVTQIANSATIADGTTSATASDSTPVITTPGLAISKSDGGAMTTPGGTVVYTLSYSNTGNIGLTGVAINELVPANTTFRSTGSTAGWSCADGSPAGTSCALTIGALASGASGSATFAVVVDTSLPASTTQIANSATIGDSTTSATGSDTTPVDTTPSLSLTKSDAGASVIPGGAVVYTLSYQNTGNVGLAGVTLNESVPANSTFDMANSSAGWSCADGSPAGTSCTLSIGTLASGAGGSVTFAITVITPVPAGTTQITNSATITAGTTSATGSDSTPVITTPSLSLAKSDGGTITTPGGTVVYRLDYANSGNVGLTGVLISELVPANTTFRTTGSTTGWSCADGSPAGTSCTLAIGALTGGASGNVTFAVAVDAPLPAGVTQIANSATITNGPISATGSDTTPVNTIPGLIITKSDGGATTTPGGTVVYALGYANTGNVGLTGVVVNETVPANTTFSSAGSSAGWSCADGSPAGTSCTLTLGALAGSASGTVTFAVAVVHPLPAGVTQIANSVTLADANGHSSANSDTTPVITAPGLSLTKSDGGATTTPGGTVVYSLAYANTGNVELTGVAINEIVPANSSFDAANSSARWSCADDAPAGSACTLALGNLIGGASGTVAFAVTANTPVPAGTAQLANMATITDGTISATGSDSTPVITTPSLSLSKSDGGATTTPGGTVLYTLSYTNTGNIGLIGVVLNESVPANTTFRATGSTAGWSCADGSPAGTSCTLAIGALAGGANNSVIFAISVTNPVPAGTTQIANSATITNGTISATGSDSTPLTTTPGLSLTKSDGGAISTPGDTIVYTLDYANTGNIGLTGVVINETVPANSTFSSAGSSAGWSCANGSPAATSCTLTIGALASGANSTAAFAVTVVNPTPAGTTQIANSATITNGTISATGSDSTPVITTPGLVITKSDGGVTTTPGGTVVYTLGYANTGNVGLTGVVINEIVPANSSFTLGSSSAGWSCADGSPAGTTCTFAIGTLAANASGSASFAVTVNPAVPAGTTQLANTVTLTDDSGHSAANGDTTPLNTTPGLALTKSDGGATSTPGGAVAYTLSYTNTGNIGLTGVVLNEIVPANSSFNSAGSTAGWSCANGAPAATSCALTLGNLAAGAFGTVTFVVAVNAPFPAGVTQIANVATITDGSTSATGSDSTPVFITPGLSITKSDGGVTSAPGGTVVYSLQYANTGNVGLVGVRINESVPANTSFNTAASSAGWSCANGSPAGTACTLSLGNLTGGASGTVTFAVTVNDLVPAGTTQLANSATITDGTTSATGSDTTPLNTTPGLTLDKSDGGVTAIPGALVIYTLGYANSGNVGLTGVVINEIVPANSVFHTIGSTTGWSCADGSPAATSCTLTIGALAGGASGTSTFAVIVANPVPAGVTQIANSATITNGPTSATSSDSTPVITTPGLMISKSDGGVTTTPGGTVAYTLGYANSGNVDLTGVAINETVPANSIFSSAGSSAGWSCADGSPAGTSCTFSIGNLAAGAAGSASFVVTVIAAVPAGTTQLTNTATLTDDSGHSAANGDTTPLNTTPGLALTKTDGGVTSTPGGTVVYTLSYSNTGDVGLGAVSITETVPANSSFRATGSTAGWSCANGAPAGTSCTLAIGALASGTGGSATFAVTVITPVPAGTTQIANSATITDAKVAVAATGSATTPVITTASLSLTKKDSGTIATPGSTIVYSLNYRNTGNIGLAGVIIGEIVPTNTTFRTTGSTAGWSCADGSPAGTSCSLTIGALAGGASGTVTFAVNVNNPIAVGGAQINNVATIRANGGTSAVGNAATAITAAPVLSARKTVVDLNGGTTVPSDVVQYAITIQNTGNTAATGVTFTDAIPANTTYVAGSTTLNGAPITDSAGAMPYATGGPVSAPGALSGQINVGETATIRFSVVINSPFPSGVTQVSNQGQVSANGVASIATDDPSTSALGDPTAITISNPTAIALVSFTATAQNTAIIVRWVTSAEFNTWGFQLYRSSDGTRAHAVRVTSALILGQGRGQGAAYSWIDHAIVAGTTYTYWLQEIELNGRTNEYGPASASHESAAAQHRIFISLLRR